MDEQKAVRRVGQMFKQTSNYLNSISNLQGVPFFAALTPDLPPFFSALRLHIYIYIYLRFLSLISGAQPAFVPGPRRCRRIESRKKHTGHKPLLFALVPLYVTNRPP